MSSSDEPRQATERLRACWRWGAHDVEIPRGSFARVFSSSPCTKASRRSRSRFSSSRRRISPRSRRTSRPRASSSAASSPATAARLAVSRRTVIFSCAPQYFSRAVPGSPGRWTRARTSWPFLNVTGRETTSHSLGSSPASASEKRSPIWSAGRGRSTGSAQDLDGALTSASLRALPRARHVVVPWIAAHEVGDLLAR